MARTQSPDFARPPLQFLVNDLVGCAGGERLEGANDLGPEASVTGRRWVDHESTADRLARRRPADDEPVAALDGHRLAKPQLHPGRVARREFVAVEESYPGRHFGSTDEKVDLGVLFEGNRRVRQQPELHIDALSRPKHPRRRQHVTTMHIVNGEVGDVDRQPAAGLRPLNLRAVRLQPANACCQAAGINLELLSDRELTAQERPGDDRAETRDRKDAVDWQTGAPARRPRRCSVEHAVERFLQLQQPLTGRGGDRDDQRIREDRAGHLLPHFLADEIEPFGIDEVALGQDDDAKLDFEEIENGEMLPRLRHRSFVGGDDEHRRVDPADAGQHVLDESLVTWHIHNADAPSARQREMSETEVDRHLPCLLFGEAVGIDPGQRFDQRRLAVVDMARRTDNEGL
jgi:hypothetical protein